MKRTLVSICLIVCLVVLASMAYAAQQPAQTRGAFSPVPIVSGEQAATVAETNSLYMKRLVKWGGFGTDPRAIPTRLEELTVSTLTAEEEGKWKVLGGQGSSIFPVIQYLKTGQPVLRAPNGQAVMKQGCGNPMVRLTPIPKKVVQAPPPPPPAPPPTTVAHLVPEEPEEVWIQTGYVAPQQTFGNNSHVRNSSHTPPTYQLMVGSIGTEAVAETCPTNGTPPDQPIPPPPYIPCL